MEKLFLVVNPKSGRAMAKTKLLGIVDIFTKGGYSVTVYPTACKNDATRAVAELGDEYKTIVCCGGDGTLNEVITGMMSNKNRYRLGYIPLGTLNEWSSSLAISRDAATAAKDILRGETVSLDIGKFNDSYFAYTASFGAFTSASYSAPQDVKNVLGQSAYFFEGIKSISNIKPQKMTFVIDGREVSGHFLFGSISNSLSMGGIIKLDQRTVKLDDGLFEMLLIENPENLADFNDILDGILKQDYKRKNILSFTAKKIIITDCENVDWTLDGEYFKGTDEIIIENVNKAISFILPKKE